MARCIYKDATPRESRLVLDQKLLAVFAVGTPNLRECGERAYHTVRRCGDNFRTLPANFHRVPFVGRIQTSTFLTSWYLYMNEVVGVSTLVKCTAD